MHNTPQYTAVILASAEPLDHATTRRKPSTTSASTAALLSAGARVHHPYFACVCAFVSLEALPRSSRSRSMFAAWTASWLIWCLRRCKEVGSNVFWAATNDTMTGRPRNSADMKNQTKSCAQLTRAVRATEHPLPRNHPPTKRLARLTSPAACRLGLGGGQRQVPHVAIALP